jgi:hypothetical protein
MTALLIKEGKILIYKTIYFSSLSKKEEYSRLVRREVFVYLNKPPRREYMIGNTSRKR